MNTTENYYKPIQLKLPVDYEKAVKKDKLLSMTKFYLPSFILGILFFVIINIKDNKEGAETYDKWCPKPKSGTQRKYAANIGEESKRKIVLIKTPNEYEKNELLDLTGELITFYIKPIPINDDYEISTSPIITSKCPKAYEKNDYVEIRLYFRDYEKLKDFISDFNKLVYCLKKYHNSNNTEEISKLGDAKYNITDNWINKSYRIFIDDSIQKWYDIIIKKIRESAIIDIENIKVKFSIQHSPIKLKPGAKPPMKIPYTKFEYIFEEDEYNNTNDDTPETK